MNILIIDNSIAFTGAFKCALNEAELLSPRHRVVFVLPSSSNLVSLLQAKSYTVYTLPLKEISRSPKAVILYPFFLIRNLWSLRKIVRKESIDVVQVNDFYNLLGAMLRFTRYKGKLITYVRFLPSVMPAPLRKLWIRTAQLFSDKVIAVSDAVKIQLPPSEKIIRIYDPVQLAEHLPYEIKHRDYIQCTYIANYTRGKGQEYALQAFAQACQQNDRLRLKFIGGDMGLEKNIAFRMELQQLAEQQQLSNIVSFHTFNADVEAVIKDADIMLNFSDAESFSMTCLEAAYYGTPLIATRCGGPEEIIEDGVTGILVPKADISAMTEAILGLASNEKLRASYSAKGREYVREKFSTDQFLKQFAILLQ